MLSSSSSSHTVKIMFTRASNMAFGLALQMGIENWILPTVKLRTSKILVLCFSYFRSMLVLNSAGCLKWLDLLTSTRVWITGSRTSGVGSSLSNGTLLKMSQKASFVTLSWKIMTTSLSLTIETHKR